MLTCATRRLLIDTIENIVWRRFADREPHGESVENSFRYRASRDLVSTRALSAIRMVVLDTRYLKWIARFSDCSESCGLVGRNSIVLQFGKLFLIRVSITIERIVL